MRTAILTLESLSPYSQSKAIRSEKEKGELDKTFHERTWREHLHVHRSGKVYIPPMAFKYAFATAARYASLKVDGKGNATYTKYFEAGVQVTEPLLLPFGPEDPQVACEWVYCHAQPTRPSQGGRVHRAYPTIQEWAGELSVLVVADEIPPSIFEQVVNYAGQIIGVGRFRPENGGYYGRFAVREIAWSNENTLKGD